MMIETFESLIENHQPLLKSIVNRIHKRLPRFIPYEDVLSCGQVGLAQAARTYQPQEGAAFSTYAYYRISGAIYDGVSRMNWTTRSEYRRYKAMQMAHETLVNQDTGEEIVDAEQHARWLANSVESLSMVYLFSAADSENPIENQLVGNDDEPGDIVETSELTDILMQAVSTLPNEEEKLLRLAYFDGLSLAEAAKSMGKSRSWGSRTHARAIKTLASEILGPSSENGK